MRLPNSRQGTQWWPILQTLVCYRLVDPSNEWRLLCMVRGSAIADLLGVDYALVEKNALYRCLDKLLEHKMALFDHLRHLNCILSRRRTTRCEVNRGVWPTFRRGSGKPMR